MFDNEPPPRRASLLSREYVRTKNRDAWLDLYAEEAIIEDPIGVSALDPDGKGHRGPEARAAFWDKFIAPADIDLEILDYFVAGNEVANLVKITTYIDMGNGKFLRQYVNGVFTYCVNDEGKLLSMRGHWDTKDPRNSLEEIDAAEVKAAQ